MKIRPLYLVKRILFIGFGILLLKFQNAEAQVFPQFPEEPSGRPHRFTQVPPPQQTQIPVVPRVYINELPPQQTGNNQSSQNQNGGEQEVYSRSQIQRRVKRLLKDKQYAFHNYQVGFNNLKLLSNNKCNEYGSVGQPSSILISITLNNIVDIAIGFPAFEEKISEEFRDYIFNTTYCPLDRALVFRQLEFLTDGLTGIDLNDLQPSVLESIPKLIQFPPLAD